jgi:cytochrome c oxidase cbb3-type subunit III
MQATKKTFLLSAIAILLSTAIGFAAEVNPLDKSPDYNYTLLGLVSMIVILLFVIGMLALTLRQLSFVVRDKIRSDRQGKPTKTAAILLALVTTIPAINSFAADAAPAAVNYISGIPDTDFYVLVGVIGLELLVIFALVILVNVLMRIIRNVPEKAAAVEGVAKKSWFWDKFNAAATIEQEKDVLLDHNYDGIQELDNSLPPWWKYGFYLTIVVAFIYIYRFHVSHDGQSQLEEFTTEMQEGEESKAAYLAKSANNVDESTVTMLTGAGEIAEGKELFQKMCVACHLSDGGGSVGPNLTDEYWLHGGGIKDIFKSIKYGWQEKGMKSWKDDFSPKEIQELASFVKSLKGTQPATPKAAQGDLYIEATTAAAGTTDSAATTTQK